MVFYSARGFFALTDSHSNDHSHEHHEHHEQAHHSHSKESDSFQFVSIYLLPVSILLASIILGWSMVSAANTLADGWSAVALPSDNAGSIDDQGQGDLGGSAINTTMAELAATNSQGKIGQDSAPILLIEYSDFQCPFCKRFFSDSAEQLKQWADEGKIQVIFKDFPLSFHPMASPSANAARCAGEQGKFWEMHDKIFEETIVLNPTGTAQYTSDDLKTWASEIGLDTAAFNSCFDSSKYDAQVQANLEEGQSVGVSGTPSFAIGKPGDKVNLIIGACPNSSFETVINAIIGGKSWSQVPETCTINVS